MASNPYVNKVDLANGTTLIDLSQDTVTQADVAQGKYFHLPTGQRVQGTASGGGGSITQDENGYLVLSPDGGGGGGGSGESVVPKQVNFVDYDGTVLYAYTATEANALTNLPANPSHTGLTAQGWNWTLTEIKAQLTAQPTSPVWVGQMYITSSGATEIDITLGDPNLLTPYIKFAVNGTAVLNWGDGSSTTTVTGTSLTTVTYTSHTYTAIGDYTISIFVTSGSIQFYNQYLMTDTNDTSSQSVRYNSSVKSVRIGSGVTSIGTSAFRNCYSLQSVTIPSEVTSIANYSFTSCYSLRFATIPSDVTSIGANLFNACYSLRWAAIPSEVTSIQDSAFRYCYALQSVTIPSNVTSIENYAFNGCYSLQTANIPSGITSIAGSVFYQCYALQSITIPITVTSIGTSAFRNCYSLHSVTIPSRVTSIESYAFGNCYATPAIHFNPTTPPIVANTNAFMSLPTDCIIYVPTGSLTAYTSASNYPSSATYTYVEE